MTRASEGRSPAVRWGRFALAGSLVLTAAKFAVFAITESTAVLSDAIESIINVLAATFALYSVTLAAKPSDDDHPYGHGRIEYFSAALEGTAIVVAGLAIIAVSVTRLATPANVADLDAGVIALSAISLATLALGNALIAAGRRHRSGSLVADGKHLRADAVTSIGAGIALVAVMVTGEVWLDPLAAIGIAVWLVYTGARILRESAGALMDEADPLLLAEIAALLESCREPGWLAPHRARAQRFGAHVHIDLHLVFPRFWGFERAHEATVHLEGAVRDAFGNESEIMVHMEPCTPRSCAFCDVAECPVRSDVFRRRQEWTADAIASLNRHGIPSSTNADSRDV